jgi:heme exporter protein D
MKAKTDTLLKKAGWFLTRVWVWLPVTLGMLVVITLILLPFAMRHGVERWLTDQGAEQARIEDIDFNLFIGQLTVRNLQFQIDGKRSLELPHASPVRAIAAVTPPAGYSGSLPA